MIAHRGLKILALAGFTAICLGIFSWLFTKAGGDLPGGAQTYDVKVVVPTAFQLVPNGDVRRAGVKIGKIKSIASRGDAGVVSIALKGDQGPIYRDATVIVRTKTLVGENYVDIDPGHPRAGRVPEGATLPLNRADEAVQLDEVLSGLDAPTRRNIRRNLDALGPGLKNRGDDLNALIGDAAPTVDRVEALTTLLDAQKHQLARVVDNTAGVMQAFANRTGDVRRLATQALSTANAAASRDQQIADVLSQLPPTLRQVRSTTTHLGRVSQSSAPVVSDLRVAARELPPVTTRLASASRAGQRLFDVLPSFSKAAEPMLRSLRTFGDETTSVVPPLDRVLRTARPALAYTKPHAKDVASSFALLGDAASSRDATGYLARVHAVVDQYTVNGLPKQLYDIIGDALNAGAVSKVHSIGNNPHPAAGSRATPGASGTPSSPIEADPADLAGSKR